MKKICFFFQSERVLNFLIFQFFIFDFLEIFKIFEFLGYFQYSEFLAGLAD